MGFHPERHQLKSGHDGGSWAGDSERSRRDRTNFRSGTLEMTPRELADTLSQMHHNAAEGNKSVAVHLFGIRYADEIRDCGASVTEIVSLSALRRTTLDREVSKGMKLSKYVTLRPDWDFRI